MEFLKPFHGLAHEPLIWLMRQAGRYLPEYRTLRAQFPGFMDFVFTPRAAAEATLQPLKRFDLDAAIIFSDILVIPHALGQHVSFGPQGIHMVPFSEKLREDVDEVRFFQKLEPIFESLERVRADLAPEKALIGFAGGPFTVALYMLEETNARDFPKARQYAFQNPERFDPWIAFLTEITLSFLQHQIRAGANVVQLFESWAALCPASRQEAWIFQPAKRIAEGLRESYPDVPLIGFPKGLGVRIPDYVHYTGVQGLSLDFAHPLESALSLPCVLQGNLDPAILLAGGSVLEKEVEKICMTVGKKPFIFNLGHGVIKETPPKNVEDLVSFVKRFVF